MRAFVSILRRELLVHFATPLAWISMTAFSVLQGIHFYLLVYHLASTSEPQVGDPVGAFFGQTVLVYLPLLFICPLLTMRTFAEERRMGTMELLHSAPIGTSAIVLGKYFAALFVYISLWVPTLAYMLVLERWTNLDWHVVASSYLGVALVGAGYVSVGVLASSISSSQLTAAVLSSAFLLGLFMLGLGAFILDDGRLRDVCSHISLWAQMNDFSKGLIATDHVAWSLTLAAAPLLFTIRVVEGWRT